MRHIFYDSLKRFLMALSLTVVGIFSAHAANLPDGYTELEYIESTGTQYIDTGILATVNTGLEIAYLYTASGAAGVAGIYQGTTPRADSLLVTSNIGTTDSSLLAAFSGKVWSAGQPISLNQKYICKINYLNSKQMEFVGIGSSDITTTVTPYQKEIPLFARYSVSAGTYAVSNSRIYYAIFTENNAITHNLIPAKNASNVVGMYDTVNNQFYTNAGTGTFTAGPIACNGTRVNYTMATGTVVQNGTPTPTNPIEPVFYKQGDMVLRKVGDYADSYDATTGKITRRVGVKVLDGTENWIWNASNNTSVYSDTAITDRIIGANGISTHFVSNQVVTTYGGSFYGVSTQRINFAIIDIATDVATWKQWLAAQYANGTPVTVYYPLATAVTEDWPAEQCVVGDGIKIATTKYTEDAFAGLMTTLSEAITKVTNIVDTTVQQATEIGNLATTKQDRPDTDCPAGRKCLLIMGADNKPHWYLIQE